MPFHFCRTRATSSGEYSAKAHTSLMMMTMIMMGMMVMIIIMTMIFMMVIVMMMMMVVIMMVNAVTCRTGGPGRPHPPPS